MNFVFILVDIVTFLFSLKGSVIYASETGEEPNMGVQQNLVQTF